MTAVVPLLNLTMPGFGIETLGHLVRSLSWPRAGVHLALVGRRPRGWRRAAAWCRRACRRREDRLHRLAEGSLSAADAKRVLGRLGLHGHWLESDEVMRKLRLELRPELPLAIIARILISPRTLPEPGGDWLNLHPGLLPGCAGASPAPYIFLDRVGGCTIHRMAAQVDAGSIVELAPMPGPLGADIGEYFFERLPVRAAGRLADLLRRRGAGQARPELGAPGVQVLRHCSSKRLAADRRLDWRWNAERLCAGFARWPLATGT